MLDTVAIGTDGTLPSMLADLPGNMKHLSESCLVVDALGNAARRELLEEFLSQQLLPYEGLFGGQVHLLYTPSRTHPSHRTPSQ